MTKTVTYNRETVDLLNPSVDTISIYDIAHNLAYTNRFNGGTKRPLSVAEHSLYVMGLVGERHKLQALMHDATEAYIGDITTPVKQALGEGVRELENRIWATICEKFNISPYLHEDVKWADAAAYMKEREELVPGVPSNDPDWDKFKGIPKARSELLELSAAEGKAAFLKAFFEWSPR